MAEFHRLLHPLSGGGGEVRPTGFDNLHFPVWGTPRIPFQQQDFQQIGEVHRKRSEDGGYPFLGCSAVAVMFVGFSRTFGFLSLRHFYECGWPGATPGDSMMLRCCVDFTSWDVMTKAAMEVSSLRAFLL